MVKTTIQNETLDAAILRAVVDSGRCGGIDITEGDLDALMRVELPERVRLAVRNP